MAAQRKDLARDSCRALDKTRHIRCNVRPCVTGHPAWRDAADTPEHNKRNNGLEVHKLSE
jgi:hypothetical protein